MAKRLLVADSDEALVEIYRRFFLRRGFAVETAEDGLECIGKLHRADAVVLDLDLPRDGGETVLTCMRDEPLFCRVPVILLLGDVTPERGPELLVAPVVDCLTKPFRLARLYNAVQSVTQAPQRGSRAILSSWSTS